MSAQEIVDDALLVPASPQPQAARIVCLIGLTLALSYLIVLGGTYLKGDFLADGQGRPIANDFVNVFAAGQLAREGNAASAYDVLVQKAASAMSSKAITAGPIRRHSCSSPQPLPYCHICLPRSFGSRQRSPPMPRRSAASLAVAPEFCSRSVFLAYCGTRLLDKMVSSPPL
jgi:hypothetical protein